MKRLMGIDFGAKTTGIALTDPLHVIVSPKETIVRDKESKIRPTLRRIVDIAISEDVGLIVVGDPVNMDGSKSERSGKTDEFVEMLKRRLEAEKLDISVISWDERLSTCEADEILEEAEVKATERKQYIDKIAAAVILEDYMKNGGNTDGR